MATLRHGPVAAAVLSGVAMVDSRRIRRRFAIKTADLEFGDVLLNCTILNMSPKGLKVCVPQFHCVPDRVMIRFGDGTSRPGRRRWRRGTDIGFEFLPDPNALLRSPSS